MEIKIFSKKLITHLFFLISFFVSSLFLSLSDFLCPILLPVSFFLIALSNFVVIISSSSSLKLEYDNVSEICGAWDGESGAWDGEFKFYEISGAWDGEIDGAWDGEI